MRNLLVNSIFIGVLSSLISAAEVKILKGTFNKQECFVQLMDQSNGNSVTLKFRVKGPVKTRNSQNFYLSKLENKNQFIAPLTGYVPPTEVIFEGTKLVAQKFVSSSLADTSITVSLSPSLKDLTSFYYREVTSIGFGLGGSEEFQCHELIQLSDQEALLNGLGQIPN
jgi:hypothetical protein